MIVINSLRFYRENPSFNSAFNKTYHNIRNLCKKSDGVLFFFFLSTVYGYDNRDAR